MENQEGNGNNKIDLSPAEEQKIRQAFKEKDLSDKIMKQVSLKTLDDVGDGTTSSTVLAQSIYNHFKNKNFQRISNQLESEINLINEYIQFLKN